ncbi:hypothetical protein OKW98_05605 [Pseudomonas sp. KU26590]|uniref:hypothetical protein n=1 Tax=Pseudomonas sp. KU26590 TaxID=2991051 RepID=UPI00223D9CC2|nr:hypothetical protein [Pseudomonas sp. KU26590]UZJ61198.1 hypothetical protein OKW98_05605 [Pseudomonas sp. KU26590]
MDEVQLPSLEMGTNLRLLNIVRRIVDKKISMDLQSRSLVGQEFIDDWMQSGNTCAYHGFSFLYRIAPFLKTESVNSSYTIASVDPSFVLGASIAWKPDDVKSEKLDKLLEFFSGNPDSMGLETAEYIWVKPLGIIWAHEGKNRVALMHRHRRMISAKVREETYPAPERMKLINAPKSNRSTFALLDDRYIQLLPSPQTSSTLLSAYGVKTYYWNQLDFLPSHDLIEQEIESRKLYKANYNHDEKQRTIDIANISNHNTMATEPTHKSDWDNLKNLIKLFSGGLAALLFSWIAKILGVSYANYGVTLSIGFTLGVLVYECKRTSAKNRGKRTSKDDSEASKTSANKRLG